MDIQRITRPSVDTITNKIFCEGVVIKSGARLLFISEATVAEILTWLKEHDRKT